MLGGKGEGGHRVLWPVPYGTDRYRSVQWSDVVGKGNLKSSELTVKTHHTKLGMPACPLAKLRLDTAICDRMQDDVESPSVWKQDGMLIAVLIDAGCAV